MLSLTLFKVSRFARYDLTSHYVSVDPAGSEESKLLGVQKAPFHDVILWHILYYLIIIIDAFSHIEHVHVVLGCGGAHFNYCNTVV